MQMDDPNQPTQGQLLAAILDVRDFADGALTSLKTQMDARFEAVDRRFDDFEHRMNRRFDRIDQRFDSLRGASESSNSANGSVEHARSEGLGERFFG